MIRNSNDAWGWGAITLHWVVALLVVERARLQRFEVQPNRGEGCFQLVGDGVDERVVFLIATDFEHEEHGVDDQAGDDQAAGDDAEDKHTQRRALGGDDDPADIE